MLKKVLVVSVMALALAGCETARQDRVAGGALIGGGTGALVGGLRPPADARPGDAAGEPGPVRTR